MEYARYFEEAQKASRTLVNIDPASIEKIINSIADAAVAKIAFLLQENKKDLDKMDPQDPRYDRLKLTDGRISDIATDMRNVASLNNPLGKILVEKELENGLKLSKITVPLGVVGIVYEARPNVTFDVVALCLKTGNVAVLKGGSDAEHSNMAIISLIHEVLKQHGMNVNVATLLPAEREATAALLNAVGYVDVLIPRGSQGLIDFVRQQAKVPVIETGAGIVHTYFDEMGDLGKGAAIILNAKTRRPSVCNALDCLIVHQNRLGDLPTLLQGMIEKKVEVYADEPAFRQLQGNYPGNLLKQASPQHFGTEFLSLKMAVKTVQNMAEALEHIANYSSKHSEAIISEDASHIETFLNTVDAAAVYANASTAFTDGAQFGLGAEIGISTQKLHARGPMGLEELCSYKWAVKGQGQVRD